MVLLGVASGEVRKGLTLEEALKPTLSRYMRLLEDLKSQPCRVTCGY